MTSPSELYNFHFGLFIMSNMRTVTCHPVNLQVLIFIIFFLASCKKQSTGNEIPISTTSEEALKYFMEGRERFEDVELVPAASLFDKAIQTDTSFALAYLYRSQAGGGPESFRSNLDKAVSLMDKVSDGERNVILYDLAMADDNSLKQKEYLDQLLLKYPFDKRVNMMAGRYYDNLGDYSAALIHYYKATELDRNFAPAYNRIGYCQSELNNYGEAEKAFLSYIDLLHGKANPYDSYAEFLLKFGKYDESIEQYRKAAEIDPVNFAGSLIGIGNNYVFKGDFVSARKYYEYYSDQSEAINGKLIGLTLIAVSYVHEGRTGDALMTFEQYRALAEEDNRATLVIFSYIDQAAILRESGNPAEALEYLEKAIDLVGKLQDSEPMRELLVTITSTIHFYNLAVINEINRATSEAEQCRLRIESRNNPGETMQLKAFLAILEFVKGNYDKAIELYNQVDIEDPWNWYHAAMSYKNLGEKQKAQDLFKKITRWNVNSLALAFVRNNAIEELEKME